MGSNAFIYTLHKMQIEQERFEMSKENIDTVKEEGLKSACAGLDLSVELKKKLN